jgi:uncharacterized protein
MLTKAEILSILKDRKPALQSKFPIEDIALFGSYARGEETAGSDIDILVQFRSPVGFEFIDLLEELESLFSGIKVDLVSKKGVKPHYLPYIEEDAIYV